MDTPFFSIIIPIFNAEKYIRTSLESVVNQSFPDIEIVCVNDASEDNCGEILKEVSEKDSRIIVINEAVNVGTSKARKDGVLQSRGKYILFLDADDELDLLACEKIYGIIQKKPHDMIQYGIKVMVQDCVEKKRAESVQEFVTPYIGELDIPQVLKLCLGEGKIAHNLCGKTFNGNICRKAFRHIDDKRLIMAEDLYAFFTICLCANSFLGVEDILYKYNYGYGITGEQKNYFAMLEIYCSQVSVGMLCEEAAVKLKKKEAYNDVLISLRHNLIQTCISFFTRSKKILKEKDIETIQEILCKYWDKNDLAYMAGLLLLRDQGILRVSGEKKWMFPFDKVPKDSTIILYGAGDVGQNYFEQIKGSSYCKIAAWVDMKYDSLCSYQNEIRSPDVMETLQYDFIIIAVRSEEIKASIKESLINSGIDESKIIF